MDLDTEYYLLLIDLKRSTELPNKELDKKMEEVEVALKQFNEEQTKTLVLPLSVSYGDEVAGLFHHPGGIYKIISGLRELLHPLTGIRFVVAKGKIGRQSEDIRQVGGKIFKTASRAMENLKAENGYCSWVTGEVTRDKNLTALCELSNLLVEKMSNYQRRVYNLLKEGKTQKAAATELGKYTQSIWNAAQAGKAEYIIAAEKVIALNLEEIK